MPVRVEGVRVSAALWSSWGKGAFLAPQIDRATAVTVAHCRIMWIPGNINRIFPLHRRPPRRPHPAPSSAGLRRLLGVNPRGLRLPPGARMRARGSWAKAGGQFQPREVLGNFRESGLLEEINKYPHKKLMKRRSA